MDKDNRINPLRVIVMQEGEFFVAQCLEKDIGSQGSSIEEMFNRLIATIILETPYMGNIQRAPKKFFDMWVAGEAFSQDDFLPDHAPFEARRLVA